MLQDRKILRPVVIGVAITVIGGLLLAAVLWAIDLLAKSDLLPKTLSFLWSLLTYKISLPCGVFALVVMAALLLPYVVTRLIRNRRLTKADYLRDEFDGVLWKWSYDKHNKLIDIRPFCPKDQTQLVQAKHTPLIGEWTELGCETCGADYPLAGLPDELVKKVRRQIEQRLTTGEWKSGVERDAKELEGELPIGMNANQENQKLSAENKELKEALEVKGKLVLNQPGNAYFIVEDGELKDGPFCTNCWDSERKAIHIHYEAGGTYRGTFSLCPQCKAQLRPRPSLEHPYLPEGTVTK